MGNLTKFSLDPTVAAIYAAIEGGHNESKRQYLGASAIGEECSRKLWLSFRQVKHQIFDGRMLRLFETGHLEEPRLIKNLRDAGVDVLDVDPNTGEQWAVSFFGGHFRGHADGAALGLHAAPKTWHLLEFKTHNAKSFAALKKDGVQISKPEHFDQMQVYMHGMELTRAYYLARNKDTDELYAERIHYDETHAIKLLAKAQRIIFSSEPSLPIGKDASFFKCKWCHLAEYCYKTETDLPSVLPDVNCRTCIHSTPLPDGSWICEQGNRYGRACDEHRYIPMLFPNLEYTHVDPEYNVFYRSKNSEYINSKHGLNRCL